MTAIPMELSVKLSDVTRSGKTKMAASKLPKCIGLSQGLKYQMRIVVMLFDQTGRNRKLKIQDSGLQTSITFISASTQVRNEIPTAIPMFLGSYYQIRIVVML